MTVYKKKHVQISSTVHPLFILTPSHRKKISGNISNLPHGLFVYWLVSLLVGWLVCWLVGICHKDCGASFVHSLWRMELKLGTYMYYTLSADALRREVLYQDY